MSIKAIVGPTNHWLGRDRLAASAGALADPKLSSTPPDAGLSGVPEGVFPLEAGGGCNDD
jgi:hypothetical protein